ncbi:uncharacterized protein EV422DRAFT_44401 [Fimicolochytrium jonesii]|uniref:uncharacterized protein n=1 Tax=Fimicolochytrium jonesii TaxID=1396493 RepID=UPI0022FE260E|nr:uncharacterized protein EV422DRAFT_44401 [Fimicolochytrium jonesii]KAI8821482.1 hypothetical protein EV422DRAFT_44401 [Fimicolochytrium jonesii]
MWLSSSRPVPKESLFLSKLAIRFIPHRSLSPAIFAPVSVLFGLRKSSMCELCGSRFGCCSGRTELAVGLPKVTVRHPKVTVSIAATVQLQESYKRPRPRALGLLRRKYSTCPSSFYVVEPGVCVAALEFLSTVLCGSSEFFCPLPHVSVMT